MQKKRLSFLLVQKLSVRYGLFSSEALWLKNTQRVPELPVHTKLIWTSVLTQRSPILAAVFWCMVESVKVATGLIHFNSLHINQNI